MAALPAHVAHAKANAPGFAPNPEGRRAERGRSRKALARLPVTRKSDLCGSAEGIPAARRAERHAGREARQALRVARADLRPGGSRRGLVAHRARPLRRRLPRRRPRDQHLRLPLHACRLDARVGGAGARLHRHPGGDRPDGDAGRGDPRTARAWLRRHAVLPEAHRREGRRDQGRHLHAQEGAGRAPNTCRRPCGRRCASAASRSPRCTAAPTSV